MTNIITSEMSLAEAKARIAALEAEQEGIIQQEAQPFFDRLVRSNPATPSKAGKPYVGFYVSMAFKVDGRDYTVSMNVKDVEASKTLKKVQELEAKKAEYADLLAKLAGAEAGKDSTESDDSPES